MLIGTFKYYQCVIIVVKKGDCLTPRKKHKSTIKSKKVVRKTSKSRTKPKKHMKAVKALKSLKNQKQLKNSKVKLQKIQIVNKENVEKEIKRIYDEREQLEMKKLYVVLSEPYARQLLIDLAGENALEIVRNFYGNLSDEDLAKKLKLKISDVRATLNRLHSQGLVKYARDKDNETGWYSYSWTLNRDRIKNWVEMKTREKIDLVNGGMGDHYVCLVCGPSSIVKFEIATDLSFRCQKCNKNLEFLDQQRIADLIAL